jgi:hypothetical protein
MEGSSHFEAVPHLHISKVLGDCAQRKGLAQADLVRCVSLAEGLLAVHAHGQLPRRGWGLRERLPLLQLERPRGGPRQQAHGKWSARSTCTRDTPWAAKDWCAEQRQRAHSRCHRSTAGYTEGPRICASDRCRRSLRPRLVGSTRIPRCRTSSSTAARRHAQAHVHSGCTFRGLSGSRE